MKDEDVTIYWYPTSENEDHNTKPPWYVALRGDTVLGYIECIKNTYYIHTFIEIGAQSTTMKIRISWVH